MTFDVNDELFEDILIRQLNSFRIDAAFRKKVLKDLQKLEADLVKELKSSGLNGSKFKTARLEGFLKSVKEIIETSFGKIDKSFEKSLKDFVKLEAEKSSKVLSTVVALETASISTKVINNIYSDSLIEGAPTYEWWARQSTKLSNAFADNIRQGLLKGETNDQLIKRIRGTKAFNFTNGIMEIARNDAETLIRSSVQTVANQTRFATFEENEDIIQSYQHVSTLDSRTTDQCVVRDGLRWEAKTKKPIKHNLPFQIPPIHWGCRSTLIAILKGADIPNEATRASVDGPVKANKTFKDFLNGKPKEFVEELLGKGKAKLYLDGKITLRQLLDQSGNPLTLAELKKIYNI